VTYFWGVPGCVTKCDRGSGVKIGQNSVTYFMDGPIDTCMNNKTQDVFLFSGTSDDKLLAIQAYKNRNKSDNLFGAIVWL